MYARFIFIREFRQMKRAKKHAAKEVWGQSPFIKNCIAIANFANFIKNLLHKEVINSAELGKLLDSSSKSNRREEDLPFSFSHTRISRGFSMSLGHAILYLRCHVLLTVHLMPVYYARFTALYWWCKLHLNINKKPRQLYTYNWTDRFRLIGASVWWMTSDYFD